MDRKRFSYANVVATLALAIAIGGGTAFAAVTITKSSQLKNGVVTNLKVKKGTLAADRLSPAARAALKGNVGPAGPPGPSGNPGAPGSSGSTAPALLFASGGVGGNVPITTSWHGVAGGNFGSEAGAQAPVPSGTPLIARDLTATVSAAPGMGFSVVFTLRVNNGDTALTCTIADLATSCTVPSTTTVNLTGGQKINYMAVASANFPVRQIGISMRVVF
jgi:hypothetical protein